MSGAKIQNRWTVRILFAAIGSVAALACIAIVLDWANPFNDKRFSKSAWDAVDEQQRAAMCEDLIANYLRPGMSKADVIDMLGQVSQSPPASDGSLSYDIGQWSLQGMDSAFLRIEFDKSGQLVVARVDGF